MTDLSDKTSTLSDRALAALQGAFVTRGANRGQLLANAPKDKMARMAWNGAQMVCNPYKVSICALMFASDEEKAIFDEVQKFIESLGPLARGLDRDRLALERLGVW